MSLEQAHQRSLQERPHHPDEPQPIKWTGRRAEAWTYRSARFDYAHQDEDPTGKRVA